MAVKGNIVKFTGAPDINQNWSDEGEGAEDIRDFRLDPKGFGWLADRGLEPWWRAPDTFTNQPLAAGGLARTMLEEKIDSFYIWHKQNDEQAYYLIEQGGTLYYVLGNKGPLSPAYNSDVYVLQTGRHIPKQNEAGTQYVPYGNKLLILNGVDKPIWFYGRQKTRDFGFLLPTATVDSIDIKPTYLSAVLPTLEQNTAAPSFAGNSTIGLGDVEQNDTSRFSWRMSFILDTGAESPLGSIATESWQVTATNNQKKFGVFLSDIPIGPEGCVARKIYRTKNQRSTVDANARDQIFYETLTIRDNSTTKVIDIVPDSSLIVEAPALTDSDIISSGYITGEAWDGRMWLAGGGSHPTRIIYSDKGIPEQFGTFSYFELGNTTGGHITKLQAYYNNLIVFRERAIDIIRPSGTSYTVSNLTSNVGTKATNTIKLVPNVGIVFLSRYGFFVLQGGLDGGSLITIRDLSNKISKELERINVASLAKSFAVYSDKENEYWCHYPRRGNDIPTRGIVLHQKTGQISFRGTNDSSKEYLYQFTAGDTDAEGNIIFGTKPSWLLSGNESNARTIGAKGYLVHLQVWSGAPYWSQEWTVTANNQDVINYTTAEYNAQKENIWESNWYDFGDASIKYRAFSVELEMITYGDNLVYLDWGNDYDSLWYEAGGQKVSKPELVFTTNEDPVFNSDTTITKSPFVIGTSKVKSPRKVFIRWDVRTKLVDVFRWRIRSEDVFHLLSFRIVYSSQNQLPLNQRTSVRGQPY